MKSIELLKKKKRKIHLELYLFLFYLIWPMNQTQNMSVGRMLKIMENVRALAAVGNENHQKPKPDMRR